MKSFMIISMLLAISFAVANAKISGGLFRHPKYPGKCTIDDSMILAQGEYVKNPYGQCALVTCFENGHAAINRCVHQGMREGCSEGKYLYPDAPYPLCCKREITCDRYYYSPYY